MPGAEGRAADYANLAASGNALDARALPGVPGAPGVLGVLDAVHPALEDVPGAARPVDLGAQRRPAGALGVDHRAAETAIRPVMGVAGVLEIANHPVLGVADVLDGVNHVPDVNPIAAPAVAGVAGVNRVPGALGHVPGAAGAPGAVESVMVAALHALDAVRVPDVPGAAGAPDAARPADLRVRLDVRDAVLDADRGAQGARDVAEIVRDSAKIPVCQHAQDVEIIVRGLATDRRQVQYRKGEKYEKNLH